MTPLGAHQVILPAILYNRITYVTVTVKHERSLALKISEILKHKLDFNRYVKLTTAYILVSYISFNPVSPELFYKTEDFSQCTHLLTHDYFCVYQFEDDYNTTVTLGVRPVADHS